MKFKKVLVSALCIAVALACVACNKTPTSTTTSDAASTATEENKKNQASENKTLITLEGDSATVSGEGAEYKDNKITITKSGEYTFSGTLNNGQIYVNATKSDRVYIILNNANITCKNSAAIYIACADKTTIIAEEGTTNKLTDSKDYEFAGATDEPNACIFSADDMTIKGKGSLEVIGNYKNGISSKNDITIKELTLKVDAYNTGIRGKDSVEIESGKISVNAQNDGIKSNNSDEAGKGYILITGGEISIIAGDDALQAETDISISGCSVATSAEGKSVNCAGTTNIADGCLK